MTTDPNEAQRAIEQAERDLERTRRKWGPIHRLVASLEALSAENHFTDKIVRAMRGEST
jgi:hypothetical protein